MKRRADITDLTDAEFLCWKPHLPPPQPLGRPCLHPVREILDAIFYVVRTGCQWRLLPHEFPPWPTVYHWFRRRLAEYQTGAVEATPAADVLAELRDQLA